ncbi:hypothetical protein LB503_006966 [Fusarium chuoi]|nr:hypothetical protein LB503_006966 [Fusarium chuoi]
MSAPRPVSRCLQRSSRVLSRSRVCPARSNLSIATISARSSITRRTSTTVWSGARVPMASRPFSTTSRLRDDDQDSDPASIERDAAIRLKQLANEAGNEDFRVLVLEKAGDLGAHILSGAVIQPTSINELIPDWLDENNPNRFEHATPAGTDPPPQMTNHGNYIVSLNQFVKWLGERAEEIGVEVYPGFAASEVVYASDGSVKGVATNDLGVGRDGKPKETFERGMEFHARVINKFDLRRDSQHQTYGLGVKEVWEIDPAKFEKGLVAHSMGYPLPKDVYGGSFMYHFGENLVQIGLVRHPLFRDVLEGGKCISYGARALIEGGFQSIPKVAFPGGALIGDSAGFVNVPKVKGTHNAMKSGMLAAEAAWTAISEKTDEGTVRNMRPSFHTPLGLYGGIVYSGLEAYVFKGRVPWTLKHKTPDHAATLPADKVPKIEYEKADGKLTFDILTRTNHEEDQPVHLQVKDWDAHTESTYPPFKGLENRFCPAGVYEYVEDESKPHGVRFQINAQNCIHCKTCDIKAPHQDINWQVPQGGEGPKYYMT